MQEELRRSDCSGVYDAVNVNLAWSAMESLLTDIFKRHVPIIKKHVKGKPSPWLTTSRYERTGPAIEEVSKK